MACKKGRGLGRRRRVKLHRKVKKQYPVYKCPACHKYYKRKCGLAFHLKMTHLFCGIVRQLKCNICGHIFSTRMGFDVHKRRTIEELRDWFREGLPTVPSKKAQGYLIRAVRNCHGGRFNTYLNEFKRYL